MKEHLKEAFAKGFQEECEKIAVLPALAAAAVPIAKSVGTAVVAQKAGEALGNMGKKKQGVPTV